MVFGEKNRNMWIWLVQGLRILIWNDGTYFSYRRLYKTKLSYKIWWPTKSIVNVSVVINISDVRRREQNWFVFLPSVLQVLTWTDSNHPITIFASGLYASCDFRW